MKLKLDANGNAVLQDGKPVYVHDDGKEVALDAATLTQTISRLNFEAKTHREAKEAAEADLKAFEGIDPSTAKKAFETYQSIEGKKLIDAGEVDKVREQIKSQYEPISQENATLKQQIYDLQVTSKFATSNFIKEKVAIPSDLVQAAFAKNFALENGKVIAKDSNGNPIYSRSNIGATADFDEALEVLISQYPNKDHILKGSGNVGSGATGSTGQSGGKPNISRAQFDALDPAAKMEAAKTANIIE